MRRVRYLLLAAALIPGAAFIGGGPTAHAAPSSAAPSFGPNVLIFNPTMSQATIQAKVDAVANQQVDNQFGTQRYALLFEPGSYGSKANPLVFQVGYYTEVVGLGLKPADVVINGAIVVFNQCFGVGGSSNCIALDNFWRSMSNLTINVTLPKSPPAYSPPPPSRESPGCLNSNDLFAISQASPIRRVQVNGFFSLFDYCGDRNFSSGGFAADSNFSGGVLNGSQQQFLIRNSSIAFDTNSVWNQVFSGVIGAPKPEFSGNGHQVTTLPASPVTREKPYLYLNGAGRYRVFVPDVQHNSAGTTWASGATPGRSISVDRFFIATPSDSVDRINAALQRGRDLILTPGVYHLDGTIRVTRPDTVVLGLGFPTLVPDDGNVAMATSRAKGIELGGMLFDAGPESSPALLVVGVSDSEDRQRASAGDGDVADPATVQDVFFRIGGATPGKARTGLVVNSDNAILDDIWAWRADHGTGVGWRQNTADTGVVVTGDNVTAYGLFVEHYQKYEVIWTGQNGTDVFFQNELPYDPPSQDAWSVSSSQPGYPAFWVTPHVTTFNGYGMCSYVVFIQTRATLFDAEAYESPTTPGVRFQHICTVWIAGSGGDLSIINGIGGPDTSTNPGVVKPVDIASYP